LSKLIKSSFMCFCNVFDGFFKSDAGQAYALVIDTLLELPEL